MMTADSRPALASQAIAETRLIVVLRHLPMDALDGVAAALIDGGVRVVELAMNTPDAIHQLHRLTKYNFCLGAGTVLDEPTAAAAASVRVAFLFSPIRKPFFLPFCRKHHLLGIPGGLTPTEIYRLHEEGAAWIKLFPGSLGPPYLREILAPCENLCLVPTGGVSLETVEAYLEAGAAAVAVGTRIAAPLLADQKNYREIRRRASRFVERIQSFSGARKA